MKTLTAILVMLFLIGNYSSNALKIDAQTSETNAVEIGIFQAIDVKPEEGNKISAIAWQSNGNLLAVAEYISNPGSIKLWNVDTQQYVSELVVEHVLEGPVLKWSPNGERLASVYLSPTSDDTYNIYVWDIYGETYSTMSFKHAVPYIYSIDVAWSIDSQYLMTFVHANTSSITIWEVASGNITFQVEENLEDVQTIAWNSDLGRIAMGMKGGAIQVVNDTDFTNIYSLPKPIDNWGTIRWLDWSMDGRYLIVKSILGSGDALWIWDLENMTSSIPMQAYHSSWITSQAICHTTNLLATAGEVDQKVNLWQIETTVNFIGSISLPDRVTSISWNCQDMKLATAIKNGSVILWQLEH